MRLSMLTRIAVFIACPAPLPHLLEAGILLHQLLHQTSGLVAVKAGNLPDIFVTQARLVTTGTLHQNAEYAGFGGFPVNAAAGFALAILDQSIVELRLDAPVSAPSGTPVFDVTGRFHCG